MQPCDSMISSARRVVFAAGGQHILAFGLGLDSMTLHQSVHALFANPDAPWQQFLIHESPAGLEVRIFWSMP